MSSFSSARRVLVAGGAGYIGSHTVLCLLESGLDVVVADNFVNSSAEGLRRVREKIVGCDESRLVICEVDLCDIAALTSVFDAHGPFAACIHFAGLKAVGESVAEPVLYYHNNLLSTTNLLTCMDTHPNGGCRNLVFSSSATVYGEAQVPITESTPAGAGITNPYGRTKYFIEEILKDFIRSKQLKASSATASANAVLEPWRVVVLRYFNPAGCHPSGLIGEDPAGIPNNLMPYVAQVAGGRRDMLTVFGGDYPGTVDGTGVRDYIHVMDLAEGHVAALKHMGCGGDVTASDGNASSPQSGSPDSGEAGSAPSYEVFNLGTGRGFSVLQMVAAMEKACGHKIPYVIGPRRAGDIAVCYADCTLAESVLHWKATRGLDDMCSDMWRWQQMNPKGYSA